MKQLAKVVAVAGLVAGAAVPLQSANAWWGGGPWSGWGWGGYPGWGGWGGYPGWGGYGYPGWGGYGYPGWGGYGYPGWGYAGYPVVTSPVVVTAPKATEAK